jgi:release factor glutamine methyltransferase
MAQDAWTIGRFITWTKEYFEKHQIPTARLDAEILLASILKVNRIYLYTHFDQPLTEAEREPLRGFVKRRAQREPIAYILGEREFYGRMFQVTPDVLIPRPETELLVDTVLAWVKSDLITPRIVDLCTGSGAVAVTLAAELPDAQLMGTDISSAALHIAHQNARRLVERGIEFRQGDLFAPLVGEIFDIIVANPPYVGRQEAVDPEIAFEPQGAVFSGVTGFEIIERLCLEARSFLKPGGLLAFEIGSGQHEAVLSLMSAFFDVSVKRDLQGFPRVVIGRC